MSSSAGEVWSDTFTKQFLDYSYPVALPNQDFTLQRNGSDTYLDIDSLTITCDGNLMSTTFVNQRTSEDITAKLQATDLVTFTIYLDDLIQIHTDPCASNQVVHINAHEHTDAGGAPFNAPVTQKSLRYTSGTNPVVDTAIDGTIAVVDGTTALLRETWHPVSGHPVGDTYVYISDDADNYYVSLDVTSDNTNETRGEDFWKIFTLDGKEFFVNDFTATYGVCGFTTTSKVSYPHATCEMKIPKSEIGSSTLDFRMLYYGTSQGGSTILSDFTKTDSDSDNIVAPGQVVTYTINLVSPNIIDNRYSSITDTIDPAFEAPTNITLSPDCGTYYIIDYTSPVLSINTIIFQLGATTCTITYDVVVKANAVAGTTINNTATITDPTTAYLAPATANATASTLTVGSANVFDPPSGYKTVNAEGLPVMTWKMVWINDGNIAALNTQVLDPVPAGTSYIAGSVACEARGTSTTAVCVYDATENRVRWEGNIAPDSGAIDEASAANEVVITFSTSVPATVDSVSNQARAYYDANGTTSFTDDKAAGQVAALTDSPASAVLGDATVWRRSTLANTGQPVTGMLVASTFIIVLAAATLATPSVRHRASRLYRLRRDT
jgi:fimbrial isopeptide formation D2 family protein/uncharacterized repeat protein (TIGR01451 family)